jgi:hypothetical protein
MATEMYAIIRMVTGLFQTDRSKATRAHVPLALGLFSLELLLVITMRLPLSARYVFSIEFRLRLLLLEIEEEYRESSPSQAIVLSDSRLLCFGSSSTSGLTPNKATGDPP